jgi:hypothetical protein
MYKNSTRTSQTILFAIIKTNRLVLFVEIMIVYYKHNMKQAYKYLEKKNPGCYVQWERGFKGFKRNFPVYIY